MALQVLYEKACESARLTSLLEQLKSAELDIAAKEALESERYISLLVGSVPGAAAWPDSEESLHKINTTCP